MLVTPGPAELVVVVVGVVVALAWRAVRAVRAEAVRVVRAEAVPVDRHQRAPDRVAPGMLVRGETPEIVATPEVVVTPETPLLQFLKLFPAVRVGRLALGGRAGRVVALVVVAVVVRTE